MSGGNHARLRHWFARFRRRTLVVSQSVAMVERTVALFERTVALFERTVALFAHYHCNHDPAP